MVRVHELSGVPAVDRELVLIKVAANESTRNEISQIVDIFRARIVDFGETAVVVEATGDSDKVTAIENKLKKFGIAECRISHIRRIIKAKSGASYSFLVSESISPRRETGLPESSGSGLGYLWKNRQRVCAGKNQRSQLYIWRG